MPTDTPLFSIITPSLNQADFIGRTVESVLSQDYSNFEYLVMDGGSTDETLQVLSAQQNDRLEIVSQPDRGLSEAVNRGIKRSQGEVVGWLNSDDLYLPGTLSRVSAFFRDHPGVDVVYGRARVIDATDEWLYDYPTEPFDPERLLDHCSLCQPATFIRRRFWDRIGPLNESLHYCMDYEWWIRGCREAHFEFLPQFLAASRLHRGCKTMRRRAALDEILTMLRQHGSQVSLDWIFASANQRWIGSRMPGVSGLGKLGQVRGRVCIDSANAKAGSVLLELTGQLRQVSSLKYRFSGQRWQEEVLRQGNFCWSHSFALKRPGLVELIFDVSATGSQVPPRVYRLNLRDGSGNFLAGFSKLRSMRTLWELIPLFLVEHWRWNRRLCLRASVRFLHARWQSLRTALPMDPPTNANSLDPLRG